MKFSSRWGIRWATCAAIGGLTFYTFTLVGWKDAILAAAGSRTLSLLLVSLLGVLAGWGVGFIWVMLPRWTSHRD